MSRSPLPASTYERAERLLGHNRSRLALRARVAPRWIGDGDSFWYSVETEQGTEFVLAVPERGERRPAFDQVRLAEALTTASGNSVSAFELPLTALALALEHGEVRFEAFGDAWAFRLDDYSCQRLGPAGPKALLETPSPDGRWVAFRRDENLWLRATADGEERQLSADGSRECSYASAPDALNFGRMLHNHGIPELPPAVLWSPDSRSLLTHRLDQSQVAILPLVESVPVDGGRPILHTLRYPMLGERVPEGEWVVFDTEGERRELDTDRFPFPQLSPIFNGHVWWEDASTVYLLEQSRDRHTLWLKRIDVASGEVRTLIEERGRTRVEPAPEWGQAPMVRILAGGRQALWYSQRDGRGHLYLYDLDRGELLRQATRGKFIVQQILAVDEAEGAVYLQVSGLGEEDPYLRSLVRVGLADGNLTRLDDDDLDHDLMAPPHGRWFVDSASAVDRAPVITVRDRDGVELMELERADITRLLEAGWMAPERVRTFAVDGVTPIYGVLYRPYGFDSSERYPVLDHPYPGPQIKRVLPSFDQGLFGCDAEAMAALGFAVLAIDGRGTPGRDKAFHDFSYGNLGCCGGLEDHVAALHQLAADRPWLGLDRVGIFGASGGGFTAARALLEFPETYAVGVAEAGNHDNRHYQGGWAETYDGPFDPDAAARLSNTELADRLRGHLLLIHGDVDDNVTPHLTMRLVASLIAADKDFDMLIVPGAEHGFLGYRAHVVRRRWDYLVRHLMDREPPAYRLTEVPIATLDRDALMEILLAG